MSRLRLRQVPLYFHSENFMFLWTNTGFKPSCGNDSFGTPNSRTWQIPCARRMFCLFLWLLVTDHAQFCTPGVQIKLKVRITSDLCGVLCSYVITSMYFKVSVYFKIYNLQRGKLSFILRDVCPVAPPLVACNTKKIQLIASRSCMWLAHSIFRAVAFLLHFYQGRCLHRAATRENKRTEPQQCCAPFRRLVPFHQVLKSSDFFSLCTP